MRRAILFLLALASIWATVAYAAYSLTDRDSAAIDRAVDRATALIDERGETFRTTLLGRIDKLAERYSKSEKATAILAELKSRIEEYGQEEIPEQEDELSRLFSNA